MKGLVDQATAGGGGLQQHQPVHNSQQQQQQQQQQIEGGCGKGDKVFAGALLVAGARIPVLSFVHCVVPRVACDLVLGNTAAVANSALIAYLLDYRHPQQQRQQHQQQQQGAPAAHPETQFKTAVRPMSSRCCRRPLSLLPPSLPLLPPPPR